MMAIIMEIKKIKNATKSVITHLEKPSLNLILPLNSLSFKVVLCPMTWYNAIIEKIKGIIITGSHSMVTDYEPWSVRVSYWLKNIINFNVPILGICYGHQLLADILGGKVGYNPNKMEFGTWDIYLTKEGKKDKLLGILPQKFKGHEAHSQSVLELPNNAKILAYNENDSIQSFVYKNCIWGTQFHPEFSGNITKEYLKFVKDDIVSSGKNYENIYNKIEEHKYGEMLLKRFIEIVDEHNK